MVVNDTRVFPARLIGQRLPGGGAAECFLVRPGDEPDTWVALVHPGQRFEAGRACASSATATLEAEVVGRHFHGRRTVRLWTAGWFVRPRAIDAIGHVPLPPYIKRDDSAADRERYQTVYARARGSIAAPTAGLHFTPAMLDALAARGIERASITLHVGYGTFQPIRVERVEEHRMEAERYEVARRPRAAIDARAARRPPHHRRRHDDDAHARSRWRAADDGAIAPAQRRDRAVHPSRARVQDRRRTDDELPPAAVVAADAGLGVRRPRARCSTRIVRRSRSGIASTATATPCS